MSSTNENNPESESEVAAAIRTIRMSAGVVAFGALSVVAGAAKLVSSGAGVIGQAVDKVRQDLLK